MSVLLDSNVLIALVVVDHVHHDATEAWFADLAEPYATCPITQGALIRLLVRHGATAEQARRVLAGVSAAEAHEFWPDELGYGQVAMTGVIGHRQVTDAYLAALARDRGGHLATFDKGLMALHPDVARMVSAQGSMADERPGP